MNWEIATRALSHISRDRLHAVQGIGLPCLPDSHTQGHNRNNMHRLSEDKEARDAVGPVAY